MEKQMSNGAILSIVLIAFVSIIGIGFGVFAIASGAVSEEIVHTTGEFTGRDYLIMAGRLVSNAAMVTNIALACLLWAIIIRVGNAHINTGILESVGSISSVQKLLLAGNTAFGDALDKASGTFKRYDMVQYRRYMKDVSILELIKCRTEVLTENIAVVIPHTLTVRVQGTVKRCGGFYKVGDIMLACGKAVLKTGDTVELVVETPMSYTVALNVITEYTVVGETV